MPVAQPKFLDVTAGTSANGVIETMSAGSHVWPANVSTGAAQTFFPSTTFTFDWFATLTNTTPNPSTVNATVVFAYANNSSCTSPTTIASGPVSMTANSTTTNTNGTSAAFSPTAAVTVPAGSFLCVIMNVATATNVDLRYAGGTTATSGLNSSQVIFLPEDVLLLAGLALLIPVLVRLRRRRRRPC